MKLKLLLYVQMLCSVTIFKMVKGTLLKKRNNILSNKKFILYKLNGKLNEICGIV